LRIAHEDYDAVVELTRRLVQIPSRGGIDPYGPVLECMSAWPGEHGLACRRVAGPGGATVALTCEVPGGRPGRRFVLDACLDTAPFGNEVGWTYPPTSGEIAEGWLHGRGAADSKAGGAIFAQVAARLRDTAGGFRGSVALLFDVDEHTGGFGGAKAYFEHAGPVDGVLIGYPGLDHVVTGGRGVLRARVHVHDVAGHSGSTRTGAGAITKAAHLTAICTRRRCPARLGRSSRCRRN
jgi:succinyl-diaminopimelate desuccinylase